MKSKSKSAATGRDAKAAIGRHGAAPGSAPGLRVLCGDKQWHDETHECRVCDRDQGHLGWHHNSKRIESWPPSEEKVPNDGLEPSGVKPQQPTD